MITIETGRAVPAPSHQKHLVKSRTLAPPAQAQHWYRKLIACARRNGGQKGIRRNRVVKKKWGKKKRSYNKYTKGNVKKKKKSLGSFWIPVKEIERRCACCV